MIQIQELAGYVSFLKTEGRKQDIVVTEKTAEDRYNKLHQSTIWYLGLVLIY